MTDNLPENVKFGYAVVKAIVKYHLKRLRLTGFTLLITLKHVYFGWLKDLV